MRKPRNDVRGEEGVTEEVTRARGDGCPSHDFVGRALTSAWL
jgi:hypothetical protein